MISSLTKPFPVLTGFYWFMYFIMEPLSLIGPLVTVWLDSGKGPLWFWNELIPSAPYITGTEDARAITAVWQMTNTYTLMAIGLVAGYMTIRDRVPDLADQEKSVGIVLAPLAIGDLTHVLATWYALPDDLRWNLSGWNLMIHGNISFVVLLFAGRAAWFLGIGRKSYYFTVTDARHKR
ncbi:hypothetical protein BDN72DRAFT_899479 [Pluteus cervinus]|uniref:Uncharacterized protein n=1 Tax=Pluteus cervinus TaxID=181527 RepID=A0ACD3AMV0_9AGAR|nr:hypothetical protein BDN72DRAFT_899479 [Pluteus cervinus]